MIFLGKELGSNKYPFITAELSCNHGGSLEQAKKLIQAAKEAGADAVKIQVYTPDEMTYGEKVDGGEHFNKFISEDFTVKSGTWKGDNLYNLYQITQTDYELAQNMFAFAKQIEIPMFASVFSLKSLHWLETVIECPAYKIASFEITDTNLIRKIAKTGKPVVISTGLASMSDIDQAVLCVCPENLILLHCVSAYPTKLEQTNLWKIPHYKKMFTPNVGFSDHTRGTYAGAFAVAAGAIMLEKHLTLDGADTEDKAFSLHPDEFVRYVTLCKAAALAMFNAAVPDEDASRQFRRSIYVVKDVRKDDLLTWDNLKAIRPSYGYPASMLNIITSSGKHFTHDIKAGTALKQEDFT